MAEGNASAAENAAKEQGLPVKEAHADVSGNTYKVIVTANDPSKVDDISAAIKKKVELNDWSLSTNGPTLDVDARFSCSKGPQSAGSRSGDEDYRKPH